MNPLDGNSLKWNFYGSYKDKLGITDIRGVLKDYFGVVRGVFSWRGNKDSNEVELLAVIKAIELSSLMDDLNTMISLLGFLIHTHLNKTINLIKMI